MTRSTSARSVILDALRASPSPASAPTPSAGAVEVIASSADLPALFVKRMSEHNATLLRVSPSGIAGAIEGLGLAKVVTPIGLPREWLSVGCERVDDSAEYPLSTDDLDRVDGAVTGCRLAIASTGTIVLDGGALSGRRLITLWPDVHVCVVSAFAIVATVPEAVEGVDPTAGPLTWVSGPSATSDIEFRRVEGVHGPRRLVVLVVS